MQPPDILCWFPFKLMFEFMKYSTNIANMIMLFIPY